MGIPIKKQKQKTKKHMEQLNPKLLENRHIKNNITFSKIKKLAFDQKKGGEVSEKTNLLIKFFYLSTNNDYSF